jgi:uncharacterized repeat protein (TIGR03803 family)
MEVLMQDKKQHFPSILVLAVLTITFSLAVRAQAQTVTVIAAESSLGMVQATDGNFYGAGYLSDNFNGGIFRMTPAGEISTVYGFCSQPNCADGTQAMPPVLGGDGNLYGVAKFGGNSSGSGTFYKLTLDGHLTTLYTFCPNAGCADGQYPEGVILASDGNFYGTTEVGGATNGYSGTVFRITPAGAFKLLYTFCSLANCADGTGPPSPPVQGSDGNFYGLATFGGATGHGVAYRLTSAGAYTVLYNFCSATDCLDGNQPQAVTWSPGGTLLGVTNLGGNHNSGTVFEINLTKNHFSTVHNFEPLVDGGNPFYALTLANDGNFYGVVGDPFAAGYIYEETPGAVYTSLYNFACCGLGSNPFGPLLQATNGKLYGETEYSQITNSGAIFQLSNGIGPSVQPVPVAGKVGQNIIILGNDLTGSTRVTFNGVAAAFTVESDTYIKARVPLGATTGAVSVVTPSGTLNGNPQFVVTK